MKCDGNHGGPMCADPECWNGGEPQQSDAEDAARWRAIKPLLHVARDQPGDWTCWLELACAPFRSKTTDVEALADFLAALARQRRQVTTINAEG